MTSEYDLRISTLVRFFNLFQKKKMSLSNGVFSIFLMWSSTVVAKDSVLCITIRSGTVGVST